MGHTSYTTDILELDYAYTALEGREFSSYNQRVTNSPASSLELNLWTFCWWVYVKTSMTTNCSLARSTVVHNNESGCYYYSWPKALNVAIPALLISLLSTILERWCSVFQRIISRDGSMVFGPSYIMAFREFLFQSHVCRWLSGFRAIKNGRKPWWCNMVYLEEFIKTTSIFSDISYIKFSKSEF